MNKAHSLLPRNRADTACNFQYVKECLHKQGGRKVEQNKNSAPG